MPHKDTQPEYGRKMCIRDRGKPSSNIQGGRVSVVIESTDDTATIEAMLNSQFKQVEGKHCNKQNRMSDTEIITILILFHPGDFRCFSPYYKGDACKRLKQLFSCLVSYNCFVELREEVFHELLIWVQVVSDYQ